MASMVRVRACSQRPMSIVPPIDIIITASIRANTTEMFPLRSDASADNPALMREPEKVTGAATCLDNN